MITIELLEALNQNQYLNIFIASLIIIYHFQLKCEKKE